MSTHFTRGVH